MLWIEEVGSATRWRYCLVLHQRVEFIIRSLHAVGGPCLGGWLWLVTLLCLLGSLSWPKKRSMVYGGWERKGVGVGMNCWVGEREGWDRVWSCLLVFTAEMIWTPRFLLPSISISTLRLCSSFLCFYEVILDRVLPPPPFFVLCHSLRWPCLCSEFAVLNTWIKTVKLVFPWEMTAGMPLDILATKTRRNGRMNLFLCSPDTILTRSI